MVCKNCGCDVPEGDRCIYCGFSFKVQKNEVHTEEEKPFKYSFEAVNYFEKQNRKPLLAFHDCYLVLSLLIWYIVIFVMFTLFEKIKIEDVKNGFLVCGIVCALISVTFGYLYHKTMLTFADWMCQNNYDLRGLVNSKDGYIESYWNRRLKRRDAVCKKILAKSNLLIFAPSYRACFYLNTAVVSTSYFFVSWSLGSWFANIVKCSRLNPNADLNEVLDVVFFSSYAINLGIIIATAIVALVVLHVVVKNKCHEVAYK